MEDLKGKGKVDESGVVSIYQIGETSSRGTDRKPEGFSANEEQSNIPSFSTSKEVFKVSWADVIEESDDEYKLQDEEVEIGEGNEVKYTPISQEIKEVTEDQGCFCLQPTNEDSATDLILKIKDKMYNENLDCVLSNIVRCINSIFKSIKDPIDLRKLACVDMFFRLRHEILFISLCRAYNLPDSISDVPFSKYGVQSNRTPDMIIEQGGKIIIIEVTAVSTFEKGAQSKGVEFLGFESKYKSEIDIMRDQGKDVLYIPFVFNMLDPNTVLDSECVANMNSTFRQNNRMFLKLRKISKEVALVTSDFKKHFGLSATLLFTERIKISEKHPKHKFLYREMPQDYDLSEVYDSYKEITISPLIYNKIDRDWGTLLGIIENRDFKKEDRILFFINTNGNRIFVEKSQSGYLVNEVINVINNFDKPNFFKMLKIKTNNVTIDSTDNISGINFCERLPKGKPKGDIEFHEIQTCVTHNASSFTGVLPDLSFYKGKVDQAGNSVLLNNFWDPEFEDRLLKLISKADTDVKTYHKMGEKMLGNRMCEEIDIDSIMEDIKSKYVLGNSDRDDLPRRILKMKSPFIYPIVNVDKRSYAELSYKPLKMIEEVRQQIYISDPYTRIILENCLNDNYNFYEKPKMPTETLMQKYKLRYEISNQMNQLQRSFLKTEEGMKLKRVSKVKKGEFFEKYSEYRKEYSSLFKEIKSMERKEGVKREIGLMRLPTRKKGSNLQKYFGVEMAHFKDKKVQSTTEGVGIINSIESDFDDDKRIFTEICRDMVSYRGKNNDELVDSFVSGDVRLLNDLKNKAMSDYGQLLDSVRDSGLGHSSSFISRLGHSLMFYSQMPFSSDYVRVDNLGYNNILLIVKGGSKIFKTKSSKMFRLVYPISDSVLEWTYSGHFNKGTVKPLRLNGENYVITPWMMYHESVLTDSISFYYRVCSFVVLNSNINIRFEEQFNKMCFNVLLAFHNRRQSEILLANLRYILLSTLGDFTGMQEILPEFFGFNYDRFQSFIRSCVLKNYPVFFKTLNDLKKDKPGEKTLSLSDFKESSIKNLFTGERVTKIEDLTLMIYSTFLMTKAPYQKIAERANNLHGILKIHEQYEKEVGLDIDQEEQLKRESVNIRDYDNLQDYTKDLFKNDFSIDPGYCSCVGGFLNSYLTNNHDTSEINSTWYKIMNSTWDEMATSTGLRGDYGEVEDFWGQKGYFVIYKKLLNDKDFKDGMLEIFDSEEPSQDKKRKMLRRLNKTYFEKHETNNEFLIFHAVDKVQWRGGREIYVMDIETKTVQQPIEKYMGYLCGLMDNELISVPSAKRAQVIHHSIFEKDLPMKDMLTWYLTLDCSKWAPKSVFSKFAIMFLNMSCLPNSFKIHFLNYIEKLSYKRIYFNNKEVEALMRNSYRNENCKYLIKDEKVNGYYIEMPYSWVMGIFNYTSSLMHAANQKYFSYLLMKSTILNFKEECSMTMFAHSDDSGGRLTTTNIDMARRAIILYEINLKCCNHLLSKKKSVVSRIYFEILSIIYMFKQLLALLPKFLGGLRFLPTDKGPCQDISQSYSKCIEVLISGANFSLAYIVLKVMSLMIWKFYFNKMPEELDYMRPVQYLGMPDSHPLMILICGSDSDIIRIMGRRQKLVDLISYTNIAFGTTSEPGPIKPLKFEIRVKGIKKGFEDHIKCFSKITEMWSIRNVNYHNSVMNSLNFLHKLSDSGFVGSLVNESVTRRISRAYYIRSGYSSNTNYGQLKLKTVVDSYRIIQTMGDNDSVMDSLMSGLLGEEQKNEIIAQMGAQNEISDKLLKVLEACFQAPLNICKYMDDITIEGRELVVTNKTLKPTVVQLVKSVPVFSSRFDASTLVSFIKEPQMAWAINDVRNLGTSKTELLEFLSKKGFEVSEMDPDTLLRVCRDFGTNSSKTIYLYSKVPTELRQIKSFSAFLTFISVNSFENREIQGLNLKLSPKQTSLGYLPGNMNEEIYFINNLLSILNVLYLKCDKDFVNGLTLRNINYKGLQNCTVTDLVNFLIEKYQEDIDTLTIMPAVYYIKNRYLGEYVNSEVFNKLAYYTFTKSQRVKKSWYGSGEVYIKYSNDFFLFTLYNNDIIGLKTNFVGKLKQGVAEYIADVMTNINIDLNSINRQRHGEKSNKMVFGLDYSGHLSVSESREIKNGVIVETTNSVRGFFEHLYLYKMVRMSGDSIVLFSEFEDRLEYKKIHFLPVKKTEMTGTLLRVLDKRQFEGKMMEMGLNDFEDFILTEILTEYGVDNYIGFKEMADNFQASKLYNIFRECFLKGWSSTPKKMNQSILPAPEESLTRVLIDYSKNSNDKVMKTPESLNRAIMKIRSEYPEQMSVILSEKMVESYNEMFDNYERMEIATEFSKVCTEKDLEKLKESIIKLMTHWGYGSYVNSVQEFKLVKKKHNFLYFNGCILDNSRINYYSNMFTFLIRCLGDCFKEFDVYSDSVDLDYKGLINRGGIYDTYLNFIYSICMSTYSGVVMDTCPSIQVLEMHNVLYSLLKDSDFCAMLHELLQKNYILSSIPINYKHRKDIILTLNILKLSWFKLNKQNFEVDYTVKLQRFPDNIVHFRSLVRQFGVDVPPKKVYYQMGLSDDTMNYINKSGAAPQIDIKETRYRIITKISKKSKVKIKMFEGFILERPVTNEALESEEWSEIEYELKTEEPDIENIEYNLGEIGDTLYKRKNTGVWQSFKDKKMVRATVNWIVDCYQNANMGVFINSRQVGENVAILTCCVIDKNSSILYNLKSRVLEVVKGEKWMVYTSFQDEINNDEFIDKYISRIRTNLDMTCVEDLMVGKIRNVDTKVVDVCSLGWRFDSRFDIGKGRIVDKDGIIEYIENQETDGGGEQIVPEEGKNDLLKANIKREEILNPNIKMNEKEERINSELMKLDSLNLDPETVKNIKKKYFELLGKAGHNLSEILESISSEVNINHVLQGVVENEVKMTSEERKMIFLDPSYCKSVRGLNQNDSRSIKDKGVRAEIEAFHVDLPPKVGCGFLNMSKKMKRVSDSSYFMWKVLIKNTSTKVGNKKFLLTSFLGFYNIAHVSESTEDDDIWQSIINEIGLYLTENIDFDDDDEDIFKEIMVQTVPASRLKYKSKG